MRRNCDILVTKCALPPALTRWTPKHRPTAQRSILFRRSDRHLASGGAVNFPGDIAGFVAGKEDEDGGDLGGLRGTPEDSIAAPHSLPPADIEQKTIEQDGLAVSLTIVRPINLTERGPAFLFFHGGGFVLGDFLTHERLVRDLVSDRKSRPSSSTTHGRPRRGFLQR